MPLQTSIRSITSHSSWCRIKYCEIDRHSTLCSRSQATSVDSSHHSLSCILLYPFSSTIRQSCSASSTPRTVAMRLSSDSREASANPTSKSNASCRVTICSWLTEPSPSPIYMYLWKHAHASETKTRENHQNSLYKQAAVLRRLHPIHARGREEQAASSGRRLRLSRRGPGAGRRRAASATGKARMCPTYVVIKLFITLTNDDFRHLDNRMGITCLSRASANTQILLSRYRHRNAFWTSHMRRTRPALQCHLEKRHRCSHSHL